MRNIHAADSLLNTRLLLIFVSNKFILLCPRVRQDACIFKSNQSSGACQSKRLLPPCVTWIIKWRRSTCSADLGSIQYCVSILPCYLPFPRRHVYHGNPACEESGGVYVQTFRDSWDALGFIQTAWLHLVPCLVYFTTVNNGFILNSSALPPPSPFPPPLPSLCRLVSHKYIIQAHQKMQCFISPVPPLNKHLGPWAVCSQCSLRFIQPR